MLRRMGLIVCLATALANATWAQGVSKFDGEYVGELTLTGIIDGDCTPPPSGAAYPLTISGGVVRFKYVPRFDTTLIGTIDGKGVFKATRRLRRGEVTMTGRIEGYRNLTATIASPSCMYSFQSKN
ncbi:MAG TPA: hypothetical protein VM782_08520 [Stellaceae bacterium]|nr:hypothetical protein [Stellaceae bacterium]